MAEFAKWSIPDYDIETAVSEGRAAEVRFYVESYWSHFKELCRTKKITELKGKVMHQFRMMHWLIQKNTTDLNIDYYVGYYSGILTVLKEDLSKYYSQERIDLAVEKMQSGNLAHFDEILRIIEKQEGIRHGKLAECIGVEKSTLTGIMDKIVDSGAVVYVRPGKFKYYYLTQEGKDYCERNRKKFSALQDKEVLMNCLTELVANDANSSHLVGEIMKTLYEKKPTDLLEQTRKKPQRVITAFVNMIHEEGELPVKFKGDPTPYRINNALASVSNDGWPKNELILDISKIAKNDCLSYENRREA